MSWIDHENKDHDLYDRDRPRSSSTEFSNKLTVSDLLMLWTIQW